MPIQSKYATDKQDAILNELMAVLEKHQTPADLALMSLGNAVTNVVQQGYKGDQQGAVARQFANILLQSLDNTN
ncbi:hypothetical protein CWI84_00285 [Idiomarina tyrosinivorans]|uniref:Uncharacterized protein n=2 Tax=Idiomarina tyrosinivorans TaxID=1445662 RepID=A0A432ZUN1_9GAMM|nr:hypothetical protein CWI84_00285 [Idiomarina tyrosinivorans]